MIEALPYRTSFLQPQHIAADSAFFAVERGLNMPDAPEVYPGRRSHGP